MHENFAPATYLLASHRNGTLYTGVTSDLIQRLHQHREGLIDGFTKDYGVHRLVWFEQHAMMENAIIREKRIKKWNRDWKGQADRGGQSRLARSGDRFGLPGAAIAPDRVSDGSGDGFPPSRE